MALAVDDPITLDDDDPVAIAARLRRIQDDDGIREFEKQRRASKASTWVDDDTGMTVLSGRWDPVRAEAVRHALDAEIAARGAGARVAAARQRDQVAADALHGLLTGDRRSSTSGGPSLAVLIDYDAVVEGVKTTPEGAIRIAEPQGGRPLPVETIRRIACEAGILPIVLNGDSQPLDVGRERRLATRAQRMALRAQFRPVPWTTTATFPSISATFTTWNPGRTADAPITSGCARVVPSITTWSTRAVGP